MTLIKIIMVGPLQAGKSRLANFFADMSDLSHDEYRPTKAVRVLEFEIKDVDVGGRQETIDVQLWDVSGDRRYEQCWPAVQRGADGVLLVYSPSRGQAEVQQLDNCCSWFVQRPAVAASRCLVLAHQFGPVHQHAPRLSGSFATIPQIDVNLDQNANQIRTDLRRFITQLVSFSNGGKNRSQKEALSL